MQIFNLINDDVRLYFRNLDRKSDDDEFAEIMTILKNSNCTVGETYVGPDCDVDL